MTALGGPPHPRPHRVRRDLRRDRPRPALGRRNAAGAAALRHRPARRRRPRGRDRHRRVRDHRARLPPAGRAPRRPARPAPRGHPRLAGDRDLRVAAVRPGGGPRPDRLAAVPGRRRGRGLHGRRGLDRRSRAARPPRPHHRPLRARDLGRAGARAADRRADPAGRSFEAVWAFATAAPLVGALVAMRIPERFRPSAGLDYERSLLAHEALRPGLGLSLAIVGYAAMAAFVVLHLDERAVGHGAAVFAAFAATVVATRVVGGWLPDRYGPIRCAVGAGAVECAGLLDDRRLREPRRRRWWARSRWGPASRCCSRRWRCSSSTGSRSSAAASRWARSPRSSTSAWGSAAR